MTDEIDKNEEPIAVVPLWERLPDRAAMLNGFPVKLCRLTHCQKVHYSKGLCNNHYQSARQGKLDPVTGGTSYIRAVPGNTAEDVVELNNLGKVSDWVYIIQTKELIRKSDLCKITLNAAIEADGNVVRALVHNKRFENYMYQRFQVYNPGALELQSMRTGEPVLPPSEPGVYNTFRPEKIMWAKAAEKANLGTELQTLLSTLAPDREDYEYFEKWLAYVLRNPGKPGCAVILRGVHGSGKSVLAALLETILGPYSSTIRSADIENSFNSWLEDKLMVFCEEMSSGGYSAQIRTMNELKKYIAGGTITVNRKGIPQYQYVCSARWMMFSNAKTPIIMEPTERRYSVIESFKKIDPDIGCEIDENRRKYAQELVNYLHTVDLTGFGTWTQLENLALQKIKQDSEPHFV